jgi:hypothetical protein
MAKTTKPKTYKWTIEVEVAEVWVEDGFDPDVRQWHEAITGTMLGFATEGEVSVRVLSKPSPKRIAKAQGY